MTRNVDSCTLFAVTDWYLLGLLLNVVQDMKKEVARMNLWLYYVSTEYNSR